VRAFRPVERAPRSDDPADAPRLAFAAQMSTTERSVLVQVVTDVREMLTLDQPDTPAGVPAWLAPGDVAAPDDPAVARLLPDASRDDPALAAEFRRLTQDDLRATKAAGLRTLAQRLVTTPPGFDPGDLVVPADEAPRAAAALTDVRLVLAERLGLRTDDDADALHAELSSPTPTDLARRGLGDLYEALTWLQETLVVAMTRALPDA